MAHLVLNYWFSSQNHGIEVAYFRKWLFHRGLQQFQAQINYHQHAMKQKALKKAPMASICGVRRKYTNNTRAWT